MSKESYFRRIRRVEMLRAKKAAEDNRRIIQFKMPDGSIRKLPKESFLSVCSDAIYGVTSPQAAIVTEAVSCNETGRLLELFHSCMN